jgi:hypothetical protein
MAGGVIPVAIGAAELAKMAAVALGLTAGGVVAVKAVDDAKKARDKSDPDVTTLAPTGIVQKCKRCPPGEEGAMVQNNVASSSEAALYQAYITKFPPGVEWSYRGVIFDGFRRPCTLLEAKAKYAQFLDKKKGMTVWASWFLGYKGLVAQAVTQAGVAVPRPPVSLVWCFMEMEVMLRVSLDFAEEPALGLTSIICKYEPMPLPPSP